jgi:hypothetical protein
VRRAADILLLCTLFTITFTKLRWEAGAADVRIAELFACAFVLIFLGIRVRDRDWRFPRTVRVLAVFFVAFLLVYLVGYFNLSTVTSRDLYAKGMITFAIHFTFLIAAVSHIARRTDRFFWRTVRWFAAGLGVNAIYALLSLAYAEATGGSQLDEIVLEPVTGEVTGIQLFGVTGGFNI